jgi:hypothetical protein
MSDLTCEQVRDAIELYTAGEADSPTRAAVGRHLQACAACSESHREAQQLLGLLDQRFQETERLQRLWSRLESERKRAQRPVRLVLWRPMAAAAAVLVTLGLSGWLGPGRSGAPSGPELAVGWNQRSAPAAPGLPEAMMVRTNIAAKESDATAQAMNAAAIPEYELNLGGMTTAEFRREVRAAAGTDRLPQPPDVDLTLDIRNAGRDVLPLRLDDERTRLTLDLQGPGVLDVPAPAAAWPLAGLGVVRIAAGGAYPVPVRRLVYGSRGAVRYLYWTAPGEYTVTITLRVPLDTDPLAGTREVVTSSGPIRVRVGDAR